MKNRHHVYSKKNRQLGTETKRVDVLEHRCFHTLFRDYHPKDVLQKMNVVIFGKVYLNSKERSALNILMSGKSDVYLWNYLIDHFLPSEPYYQAQRIRGATKLPNYL